MLLILLQPDRNKITEFENWNNSKSYIYTMHNNNVIGFLGWAFLTFSWLNVNFLFFGAIANAIDEHNEHMEDGVQKSG